jgi:LuxR family maltose regulon positive regulatory protein
VSTSLLTTKFYFPPARPALVARPRLVERLQAGLRGPLTLISAPAGSGKTTLVSEWRAGPGARMPVAWLSLDAADNDASLFFQYLTICLDAIHPDVSKKIQPLLQSPETPPVEVVMTVMINSLSGRTGEAALVLDDYQVIENPTIHQALVFMLEHLPVSLHLVLLTRSDPPLPLNRLRARGQLTDIRAEHLRFSVEEAAQFLNQVMGLTLTLEQVSALQSRSEGWVAGLQLAALSLQKQQDADHFVSSFTGSHHYIVDYLTEEVLNRQSQAIKTFLMDTALLNRMNASLCDSITGRSDGQAMLEKLEQNNLFIIPLDNERNWYRYHHLFADQLQARLLHSDPGRIPDLLRRASDWHARQGDLESAIPFSLKAGDFNQAAVLIEQYEPAMTSQGRVATLAGWIGALPEENIQRHPRLTLALIWVLYLGLRFEEAVGLLQKLERDLLPEDAIAIRGELALWKGIIARIQTDLYQSRAFLRQALEQLPKDSHTSLGRAHLFLGLTLLEDDANEARGELIYARDIFAENKNTHGELAALYFLAWIEVLQGSLIKASLTCRRGLHLAEQVPDWPVASYAHLAAAELLYQSNSLDQAEEHAQHGTRLAELGGHTDNLLIATLDILRIRIARGDWEEARNLLERTEDLARKVIPMMKIQLNVEMVKLLLSQGKIHEAEERWQQNQVLSPSGSFFTLALAKITHARLLLAKQEPDQASHLLAGLLEQVENAGMGRLALQILCLQALAMEAQGRKAEALQAIQHSLSAAEPEGNLRPFLDEGIPMLNLLRLAQKRGIAAEFISRIVAMIPNEEPGKPAGVYPRALLSKREVELLNLIASGCSNKEIAGELVISIGTVKRHTVNIFNKLDVKNRTEAAAKARELGLL